MEDERTDTRPSRRTRRRALVCLAVAACVIVAAHARARLSSERQQQQCLADSHDAARLLEVGSGAKPSPNAAPSMPNVAPSAPNAADAQSKTSSAGSATRSKTSSASAATQPNDSAKTSPRASAEIRFVSYNIRWRGGEELRAITKLLRDDERIGGADVVGLQEVDRARRRSGQIDAARQMAEELGWNYAWAAPPSDGTKKGDREAGEDETGVAILSPHPLAEVTRLVLPNPGPDCRRRAALGATVMIGPTPVRVYSVHAETRIPVEQKVGQWRAVLDDLRSHPEAKRVVVLGDFNTLKGKDVSAARKLFTDAGFNTPFEDDDMTWSTFIVELKLDWMWLRGLEPIDHGVRRTVTYSDHYPLWLVAKAP